MIVGEHPILVLCEAVQWMCDKCFFRGPPRKTCKAAIQAWNKLPYESKAVKS